MQVKTAIFIASALPLLSWSIHLWSTPWQKVYTTLWSRSKWKKNFYLLITSYRRHKYNYNV